LNSLEDWTAEDIAARFDVSRESLDRLRDFVALLRHWQSRINLIAPSTVPHLYRRHVADSLQLLPLLQGRATVLLDLGSGAGFPGLVLAIAGGFEATLVESNGKKAAFLREAIRRTGAAASVLEKRIESLNRDMVLGRIDAITARALAPLPRLIDYASPWLASGAPAFFLKGQNVDDELTEAAKSWRFACRKHPSVTDAAGVVLEITEVGRA
jgi:16S rRNA (guanine527-N7)-methyltransferase